MNTDLGIWLSWSPTIYDIDTNDLKPVENYLGLSSPLFRNEKTISIGAAS